jgi:hypothetical protein
MKTGASLAGGGGATICLTRYQHNKKSNKQNSLQENTMHFTANKANIYLYSNYNQESIHTSKKASIPYILTH